MDAQKTYDLYKKEQNQWNSWSGSITSQGLTQEVMNEVAKTDFSLVAQKCDAINLDGFIFPAESLVIENPIAGKFSFNKASIRKISISNFQPSSFQFAHAAIYSEINLKTGTINEINIKDMRCDSIYFDDCVINKFTINNVETNLHFNKCTIRGIFEFIGMDFPKSIKFSGCIIEKESFIPVIKIQSNSSIDFVNCTIKGKFDADGLNVKGTCSFRDTKFAQIPYFQQAHFVEAPIMDGMLVPNDVPKDDADKKSAPSRYRALRRLAAQAHDHMLEQDFLAGEIKADRQNVYNWCKSRLWFGLIYQFLSNFGRRPILPLLWLGVLLIWSCFWRLNNFLSETNVSSCAEGKPLDSAFILSLKQGLISLGSNNQKMEPFYKCLYGAQLKILDGKPVEMPFEMPAWMIALETVQMLLSGMLIYLFIKALSYQFRVK
jgi:hypothetical protein